MGQVESKKGPTTGVADQTKTWHSSSLPSPPVPRPDYQRFSASMNSLSSEAAAYGSDGTESLEAMAEKALECPCIADLRNGPCGSQFSAAFFCFLKSTSEEKGSDCEHPFIALQKCIKNNPNAFKDEDVEKEGKATQEYKIHPPSWSKDSESPKARL